MNCVVWVFYLTLSVYFRKPFLGLQGHNAPAFVPAGHLAVREWNAHAEHRDSCLVGGCRQNLLLQRRQVCAEWWVILTQQRRTEISQCKKRLEISLKTFFNTSKLSLCYQMQSFCFNWKDRRRRKRSFAISSPSPPLSQGISSVFSTSSDS